MKGERAGEGVWGEGRNWESNECGEPWDGEGKDVCVVMECVLPLPLNWLICAGGAGMYVVLQCGSAGHNIRSKPSLQGTPVGRLKLGDTFQVEDEVGAHGAAWMVFILYN